MDPHLFDLLWETYREVGATQPIDVICGYRSPGTNSMLRRRSTGVAQNSHHINGHAIDFFIPGVPLEKVRAIGLRLQRGGVGFYPTSGSPFVHLDTGTIRHWPRIPHDELVKVFPDGRTVHIPADGHPLKGYALALADVERAATALGNVAGSRARAWRDQRGRRGHRESGSVASSPGCSDAGRRPTRSMWSPAREQTAHHHGGQCEYGERAKQVNVGPAWSPCRQRERRTWPVAGRSGKVYQADIRDSLSWAPMFWTTADIGADQCSPFQICRRRWSAGWVPDLRAPNRAARAPAAPRLPMPPRRNRRRGWSARAMGSQVSSQVAPPAKEATVPAPPGRCNRGGEATGHRQLQEPAGTKMIFGCAPQCSRPASAAT